MGLFDRVSVDERFTCSEGHDLTDEEWQSKDFGETMGNVEIAGDEIIIHDGGWGCVPARPLLGRFSIYCSCSRCPAFVQDVTFNLCPLGVEYEIEMVDDKIRSIKRVSEDTATFLREEPRRPYMADCRGPFTYRDAQRRHSLDRKFFPWDPRPEVDEAALEEQRKWKESVAKWRRPK